jgi:hypothetical protein
MLFGHCENVAKMWFLLREGEGLYNFLVIGQPNGPL